MNYINVHSNMENIEMENIEMKKILSPNELILSRNELGLYEDLVRNVFSNNDQEAKTFVVEMRRQKSDVKKKELLLNCKFHEYYCRKEENFKFLRSDALIEGLLRYSKYNLTKKVLSEKPIRWTPPLTAEEKEFIRNQLLRNSELVRLNSCLVVAVFS